MRINANIMAINSHRQLGSLNSQQAKSTEKLSSGYRVNRAADDAAGLAISEKMRAQIRGMNQASRNAQDGISVVQTAEGAMDEIHAMLQRMKELSVQAANDSNQDTDRALIEKEVTQLITEINAIADKTQFNKMKLIDGTYQNKDFQVGANNTVSERITITIASAKAKGLGASSDKVTVLTKSKAQASISHVETAIIKLAENRATLGAVQNRLEHTIRNLDNSAENLTASESRIRHTDMAKEMMEFTRVNILTQAAQSMLAQANQLPQGVLQLLR